MILTVEEVLTRIDVRMDGKVYEPVTGVVAGPFGLEDVQVASLTPDVALESELGF